MKKILNATFAQELEKAIARFQEKSEDFDALMKSDEKELKERNGTFKFVISDETRDRAGEIIKVDGWELDNYRKNPVVLFAHSYYSMPVGKATRVYVEGNKLIAEGIWASDERSQTLRRMYDEGFIKTVSVGFIVKERDEKDDSIITKAELLEFSIVPVPANPSALSLAVEKFGEDTVEAMATKGLLDFDTRDIEQDDNDDTQDDDTEVQTYDDTDSTEMQTGDDTDTHDDDQDEQSDEIKSIRSEISEIKESIRAISEMLGLSDDDDIDVDDEKSIHKFVKELQGVAGSISLILRDAKKERNKAK